MKRAPILVVGAGPVGLSLAIELVRHGAQVRLIDKLEAPTAQSRAIALHARTLEVFADMGLVDAVLARGQQIHAVNLHGDGRQLAHVRFDPLDSPYPFIIDLAQNDTEALLTARAAALGVTVERGVTLENVEVHPFELGASLRHPDGTLERFVTPWVVGCDGAHSLVRKLVELPFEGSPYDMEWVLADVDLEGSFKRDEIHTFLHADGVLACFPLGGNRVRLIADLQQPASVNTLGESSAVVYAAPTRESVQAIVTQRGLAGCRVTNAHWLSNFRIHHRMTPRHRVGRVFLAGDAAHIHSPVGGQGMNTGIQDAYNLGWKLALAWQGRAGEELLESYHAERHPVAAALLHGTDAATRLATLHGPLQRALRDQAIAAVTHYGFFQQRIISNIAELEVHYHDSPLNVPHGWLSHRTGGPQAGDRVPDAQLIGPDGKACRLHTLLAGTGHVLLGFLGEAETPDSWSALLAGLRVRLGEDLRVLWVGGKAGYRDPDQRAHQRFGALKGAAFLIRPDKYVACHEATPDIAPFETYLDHWLAAGAVPAAVGEG